jgi:hypothetical protein
LVADELLEQISNRWVKVNLAKTVRCLEPLFDSAVVNSLFDEDGQKIWRDVLVDLDAPRNPSENRRSVLR